MMVALSIELNDPFLIKAINQVEPNLDSLTM